MAFSEWQYTADDGTVYKCLADGFLTAQGTPATLGGAAAAGTEPTLPPGWKKRKVELIDAGGHIREVTAYTAAAPIYTPATAINLHENHVSTAYSSTGHWRGEQPPRRYHVA